MKKIFIFLALIATFAPIIFVIHEVGGWQNWQGVLPRGTTDSLYYYARIHEVIDGHPLIGNPYIFEYRDTLSPAFFLPDIVSSIPMFLGMPFNLGVLINMFVWSLIFLILSFTFFQLLQMTKRWALLWSVLLFIISYSFMLRPTIMQVVYPMFLAFLIALLKFLYEPFVRRRIFWLSLAAAATFYTYTYLSYITLLSFTFIFFWFLFTRRFKEFRALIISGIFTALLIIPFGIYTLMQMKGLYYFETLNRIGLIYTHTPTIEAFFYGRWVVIGLLAFGFSWMFFPKKEKGNSERKIFWLATGASLLAGLFLNVITGVELTLAVHIGRFVLLWMTIILGVGLFELYSFETLKNNRAKYIVVAILLIILSVGVMRNVSRGFDFFKFNNRGNENIADLQVYAGPLRWLDENISEQSVIWANDSLAQYIPFMTHHYTLFADGIVLHNIPLKEIEDRYLLSRSLGVVTTEGLKQDFELYSGAGSSRDDEYFKSLVGRFNTIKENQAILLQHFNVKYLIIDRMHDNAKRFSSNKGLYDDGRFLILSLPF